MRSDGDAIVVGGLILAGGLSTRMGRHKALVSLEGGATFLETIASRHRAAGVGPVFAITHRAVFEDPAFPPAKEFEVLVLEAPTAGPLQTLRAALDRIERAHCQAFILHPVDFPLVRAETISLLVQAYRDKRLPIVQPRCRGRGGHPVLLEVSLEEEIRAASIDEGLRQVIRADPSRVLRIEVDDPGVLRDINAPTDL